MNTDRTLLCLSVRQPWADLIVRGIKDVENRTWSTRYTGPLLIHAGVRVELDSLDLLRDQGYQFGRLPRGAIVGRVVLDRCRIQRSSPWHNPRQWGWYLSAPERFDPPIRWRGQLRLFEVPEHALAHAGAGQMEMPV